MPIDTKDPFKPQQPAIPGVPREAWKLHQPAQAAVISSSVRPETELAVPSRPPSHWAVAPGVVATEAELAKPWAAKEFSYRDPIMDREVPAIVVHLPRGGYWGFSLIEPFGTCQLEYVTNLERLRTFYGFAADHPMVGDPCNRAVFDLLQYGGPPGAEVRGAPVRGGVRPPIAIEIEQRGKEILATKME
ncbi:MAG TPA: hypothetical protein VJS43_17000 [Candidatus Acidoferrales bacterium]|nr:hypothetical protein [Candidatus Acidoferrales bacterium]